MDRDKLERREYLLQFFNAAEAYEFLDEDNFNKKLSFEDHVAKFIKVSDAYLTGNRKRKYKQKHKELYGEYKKEEAILMGLSEDGYEYNLENSKRYKSMPINKHNKNSITREEWEENRKGGRKKKCYIMKDKRNGLYKIGYSKAPYVRETTLQSEKPDIETIKIFEDNHEEELHRNYDRNRVRGEWFKLTPVQVKYICTHYK